jgi:hypothetical protein
MQHTIQWHDTAKTILIVRSHKGATWDDAFAAVADQMAHIASVKHHVYTIYDLAETPTIPSGLPLKNLKRVIHERQPNQALTIYVGVNNFLHRLMMLAQDIFQLDAIFKTYHFVATIDEALHIIEQHRRHFPDL